MAENVIAFEKEEAQKAEENNFLIKLTRAYQFEEHSIDELDMSGLDGLTAKDLIRANKVLSANRMPATAFPEMTLDYTLVIAAAATGLPVEFYNMLKPRDAMKVKSTIIRFFFGED